MCLQLSPRICVCEIVEEEEREEEEEEEEKAQPWEIVIWCVSFEAVFLL